MNHNADEIFNPTQPALLVTHGHTVRKYRPLRTDLVVIGQGRGADIGLVSAEIADAHCVLFRTAEGWRLRDCGTRFGTRLNGKSIHESALCDGDVLQVGTFNFHFCLPDGVAAQEGGAREHHLQRSRRRLARLALSLRRRLRAQGCLGTSKDTGAGELDQQMRYLRDQLRQYEQRAQQLQQAEREVTADRTRLEGEWTVFRSRSEQSERALAQRRSAIDADVRRRTEELEAYRREVERRQVKSDGPVSDAQAAHDLDLRSRELACYARHLQRLGQRYAKEHDQVSAELQELRQENLRLRHLSRQPQPPTAAGQSRQIDKLRAELAAARHDADEKEKQIQRLLTERQVLDDFPTGIDAESYEAELAEFRRQIQEDRHGLNEEIRLLRQRTLELDEAGRAMEQQLTQEQQRLALEREELDRVRQEVLRQLAELPPDSPERLKAVHQFREAMAALAGRQSEQGSNGRGHRVRGPRRGSR
jgi:hypothetical protein